MRKFQAIVLALLFTLPAFSQTTTEKKKFDLSTRPGDHIIFQLASNRWIGVPDSIKNKMGDLNRSANIYLMLDKPFKGDSRFSVALGLGVSTSNIYFKKMTVDIAGTTTNLAFRKTDSTDHFKKFKLSTAYLEIPVEFRFMANPVRPTKSIKFAIGIKAGTMLNAHTKGKTLQNASGNTLNAYTVKESTKRYFNTTRIAATGRIGYGNFSVFGAYSLTKLFKDGVAADINPLQVGLSFSGL